MKKTFFFSNRLDDSNGSVKVTHNNAMPNASQTTETPATEKKGLGLLALLAVGVNAVASFLKSKMEGAAAVAAKVGAAVLKSKKAVVDSAAAGLVRIQPNPPKTAKNRLGTISHAILFALLSIFFASPNCIAGYRGHWAPKYDEKCYTRITHVWITIPFADKKIRIINLDPRDKKKSIFSSKWYRPDSFLTGQSWETIYTDDGATIKESGTSSYYFNGMDESFGFYRDGKGILQWYFEENTGGLGLIFHQKVGGMRTKLKVSDTLESICYENWGNFIWFRDTSKVKVEEPTVLRTFFRARAFIGPTYISSELDYHGVTGFCESSRVTYPGPAVKLTPCRPSNLGSIPFTNGYLEYTFWEVVVPDSDDDDDE